jgi:hypothetical protein
MSPIPCYGCVCRRFGRHWATRLLRRSISKRSAGKGTDWSWTGRWMPQQHRQPDPSWGEREIEALERWFQRAAHGVRQLVFVSGEAGVGKTTVSTCGWSNRIPEAAYRWRGRTLSARLRSVKTAQPWTKSPGGAHGVAPVPADVAGATARAAGRSGVGAPATLNPGGDIWELGDAEQAQRRSQEDLTRQIEYPLVWHRLNSLSPVFSRPWLWPAASRPTH